MDSRMFARSPVKLFWTIKNSTSNHYWFTTKHRYVLTCSIHTAFTLSYEHKNQTKLSDVIRSCLIIMLKHVLEYSKLWVFIAKIACKCRCWKMYISKVCVSYKATLLCQLLSPLRNILQIMFIFIFRRNNIRREVHTITVSNLLRPRDYQGHRLPHYVPLVVMFVVIEPHTWCRKTIPMVLNLKPETRLL